MGVANDVKKRWIKIYAQNLPSKEIPEELREKLEGGETEKIKTEASEISAKPKRFSVISGEIVGDPEGDYTFKEALQYVAQQRGASPDEAGSMAFQLSKMGPEMLTALLGVVTPLISKESPRSDMDTILKLIEAGVLKKSGEVEGSETIRALEMQVKKLKDAMQKQDMDILKGAVGSLSNKIEEIRKEMSNQSHLEGRYALMDKVVDHVDNQLSGLRSDAMPLLDSLAHGGGRVEPKIRTPEEKAKIAKGLKEAVALEREAHALEDELLFGNPLPREPAPAPLPTTYAE